MKRFIPIPGDLNVVDLSEWFVLKDGERLRVCEPFDWMETGEEIHVAPRHQVSTFWGPSFGEPDGYKPMHMSTSGGPFKTVKVALWRLPTLPDVDAGPIGCSQVIE